MADVLLAEGLLQNSVRLAASIGMSCTTYISVSSLPSA
jgi:hypothetical protein